MIQIRPASLALAMVLAGFGPASAGERVAAVVELFTSQGCSSCPPADAKLAELSRRPELIALTLPVAYWDYLGWRDTLARPAFAERQRAYSEARQDRAVYTPQMVVNGRTACVGSNDDQVEAAIRAVADDPLVPVDVRIGPDRVDVTIAEGTGEGDVWLMPVHRTRSVTIGRGENRGRTITYANVVRDVVRLGRWSGAPARFGYEPDRTADPRPDGFVVLVQAGSHGQPGRILGAARSDGLR